jgi:hypothetical protein
VQLSIHASNIDLVEERVATKSTFGASWFSLSFLAEAFVSSLSERANDMVE